MPNSRLFDPITLRGVEIPNRITVSPMCQYSAGDGLPGHWHMVHLGQFAVSGPGLVFVEATAVEREGRISPGCTGIWSDAHEAAFQPIMEFYRDYGSAKIGMQLGHAGRKASANVPWNGSAPLTAGQGAWQTCGPSPVPYSDGWHVPDAIGDNAMQRLLDAYVAATERCVRLGFDVLEVHAAHGYLLHQFLSPYSNRRDDRYGGSLENRMRFPLEVYDAVRAVWPEDKPLGVRLSASDHVPDSSWDIAEAVVFTQALHERGCDFIDVSSGGNAAAQQITIAPGYQVHFAAQIKRSVPGICVMAVGKITNPVQAETILTTGQADMVALARGMLYDPRWAWHAAEVLGDDRVQFPAQYARADSALRGEPITRDPPSAKPLSM